MIDYDKRRRRWREQKRRQRALAAEGDKRCSAVVGEQRCRRVAVESDMCRQHAGMQWCRARGCDKRAVTREGKWWFCRQHRRLWAEHNAIVQRIQQFRPRA